MWKYTPRRLSDEIEALIESWPQKQYLTTHARNIILAYGPNIETVDDLHAHVVLGDFQDSRFIGDKTFAYIRAQFDGAELDLETNELAREFFARNIKIRISYEHKQGTVLGLGSRYGISESHVRRILKGWGVALRRPVK